MPSSSMFYNKNRSHKRMERLVRVIRRHKFEEEKKGKLGELSLRERIERTSWRSSRE